MTIVSQLDQLAEFQAQRDLLELHKTELLNAVQVPAEILAAQDEANKARQRADSEYWLAVNDIEAAQKTALEIVKDPEMPAEYLEALRVAREKRAQIDASYQVVLDARQKIAIEKKAKIDADLAVKTAAVFEQVEARRHEIAAEFGSKAVAVDANIAALTAEIKANVAVEGHSVKGQFFHAVYSAGRVSWDTARLEGMMALIPEIKQARKTGDPSVSIRKI